jgi:hypothetical protein
MIVVTEYFKLLGDLASQDCVSFKRLANIPHSFNPGIKFCHLVHFPRKRVTHESSFESVDMKSEGHEIIHGTHRAQHYSNLALCSLRCFLSSILNLRPLLLWCP